MRRLPAWYLVFPAMMAVAVSSGAPTVQPASGPGLSIADLRAKIDRQIAALGEIVMQEKISRYAGARGKADRIDEFDASVEIAGGADTFGSLRRNGRPVAGKGPAGGAWSFGEFSTVLRISRAALDNRDIGFGPAPGARGILSATFHYGAPSHRWFISVGERIYWLDFQGEIQVSAATGDVLRISWISASPPPEAGILRVQRTVSFAAVEVGGETYILPESAEYRVVHPGNRVEWNTVRFGDPARYGSLVSVQFGD